MGFLHSTVRWLWAGWQKKCFFSAGILQHQPNAPTALQFRAHTTIFTLHGARQSKATPSKRLLLLPHHLVLEISQGSLVLICVVKSRGFAASEQLHDHSPERWWIFWSSCLCGRVQQRAGPCAGGFWWCHWATQGDFRNHQRTAGKYWVSGMLPYVSCGNKHVCRPFFFFFSPLNNKNVWYGSDKLDDAWKHLDMLWCDIKYHIQIVHDIGLQFAEI